VGLARLEFIINRMIGVSAPLLEFDWLTRVQATIRQQMAAVDRSVYAGWLAEGDADRRWFHPAGYRACRTPGRTNTPI
jgi:hypothetical protein